MCYNLNPLSKVLSGNVLRLSAEQPLPKDFETSINGAEWGLRRQDPAMMLEAADENHLKKPGHKWQRRIPPIQT
jgi:hypothetical protein